MNINSTLSRGGASWAALNGLVMPGLGDSDAVISPWQDTASHFMPDTLDTAFSLCEFLYENNGALKKGTERVVDYFLTRVKYSGGDDEARKDFESTMNEGVGVMSILRKAGVNYMCYGNSLMSLHFPFVRHIVCPVCHSSQNLNRVSKFSYNMQSDTFSARCYRCGEDRPFGYRDIPNRDVKKINAIAWDPKRVKIKYIDITGDTEYYYKIPEYIKSGIKSQDQFILRRTPRPFMDCVRGDMLFKFDDGALFHMKDHAQVAGLDLRGWAPPSMLSCFRDIFRLQILKRQQESIALDFITPVRMVSPRQQSQVGNDIINMSMSNFVSKMKESIARTRINGATWNFVPFAVEYQPIGGEGKALSPMDDIMKEEDRILNSRGVPPEFNRGSMTIQAAPVALRLFERSWGPLVSGYNEMLSWITDSVAAYMRSGDYQAELESVTVVDDLDNKMWRLQAAAAEILSKETAFGPMGIDSREEYERLLEQQKREMRETAAAEAEMQRESVSLGAPQQATQATPEDVSSDAEAEADRLLAIEDDATRNRELRAIREQDVDKHRMVTAIMKEKRDQGESIGRQAGVQEVIGQAPQQ